MATGPNGEKLHYELREFRGDWDLCIVRGKLVIRRAGVIYDRETADRISEDLDAPMIAEHAQGTLGVMPA